MNVARPNGSEAGLPARHASGQEIYELAGELFPIPRSITGQGVRDTIALLRRHLPIETHEIASGTPVFDWIVPKEWKIREAYVEDDAAPEDIIARRGLDPRLVERVVSMIDRAEYKRRQAAPGIKITPKAFGRDRRLPITNRYRSSLTRERTGAP